MKQYESYKDSGIGRIGQIPSHWACLPLKRCVQINNGRDYKHCAAEIGIPVFGSGGIFAYASDFLYDGEALLLGRKGTINRPMYVNGKFWTVDTMFYAIPRKQINCKYLYYQALGFPFDMYSTETALPSMTQSDLYNIYVAIPPYNEQCGIVSYLDKKVGMIDRIIADKEGMVKDFQNYRIAIIYEAVTRGLNPDVSLKDSGIEWIGMIPEHWQCVPMKRYMQINNGRDYKHCVAEEGYPVIGSGGQFAFASDYLYDGEALLLGRKGTINHPLYINGKFWTVDTMFYAIPKHNVSCKYMYYQALGFPFDLYSTDTALPSMTQSDLGNNPVCLPPLTEQLNIVSYLDSKVSQIDETISELQSQIEDLKTYKSSVITEAVTGKVDLR